MSVTKLEVILSGLLVLIVCEAGYHLPGVIASYFQGPLVSPPMSSAPATVVADVTPVTYPSRPGAWARVPSAEQENKRVESLLQDPSPTEDTRAEERDEVAMPLVLVDPPEGLLTSQEQVAAFDMLRQQFAESLSAFAQDPSTPEYRGRWLEAQETLDEEFASLFGIEAYNQQQNAALRAAMQPQLAAQRSDR